MNIIETSIPDVTKENIDRTKLDLSERIVKNVYPLLSEIYHEELSRVKELEKELKQKSRLIQESKDNIEGRMKVYNKKKKTKKLVDRISKLVSSGLVDDGALKNEIIVLLKVIESLSNDKLDYHLKQTLRMISKRFTT